MRIISIKTAQETEYGSSRVTVEWLDGTTTEESVPGTVPENEFSVWIEKRHGGHVRCWRHL